jgi:hypothetical protein
MASTLSATDYIRAGIVVAALAPAMAANAQDFAGNDIVASTAGDALDRNAARRIQG